MTDVFARVRARCTPADEYDCPVHGLAYRRLKELEERENARRNIPSTYFIPSDGGQPVRLSEALALRITVLEERVAFAELARDNALAMRDEVQERAKVKVGKAGKVIAELIRMIMSEFDPTTEQRAQISEILGKSG
jgi:hypothetical protein